MSTCPLLATLALLSLAPLSAAQDETPSALIERVRQRYQELPAYADEGAFRVETLADGEARLSLDRPLRIALIRPDRLAIDAGPAQLLRREGSSLTLVGPLSRYDQRPVSGPFRTSEITEGPVGAMILGGPSRIVAETLLGLIGDEPPSWLLGEGWSDAPADPAHPDHRQIERAHDSGLIVRLRIDPATALLQAIRIQPPEPAADAVADESRIAIRMTWDAGAIQTDPSAIDPARFEQAIPEAYQSLSPAKAAQDPAEAPRD